MKIEIILIGNELLIGKIQDTNGKWIIDQLVPHGIQISRIITIPDELDAISSTIKTAINRKPDYILTSGGLGPTFDDMTLDGIARGLPNSNQLVENQIALAMVKERYQKIYPDKDFKDLITPARLKMAILPKGSFPLSNRAGSAPGVIIPATETCEKTIIYCLPGVPRELKVIFEDHILPELLEKMKDKHFNQCGFIFRFIGESKFTELIYEIKDQYPRIWIKTHPKMKEKMEVELHLTSFSQDDDIPEKMDELYNRLYEHVIKKGGEVVSQNPLDKPF
jgi:molybdenum cofactor synthesis domain-containing protein